MEMKKKPFVRNVDYITLTWDKSLFSMTEYTNKINQVVDGMVFTTTYHQPTTAVLGGVGEHLDLYNGGLTSIYNGLIEAVTVPNKPMYISDTLPNDESTQTTVHYVHDGNPAYIPHLGGLGISLGFGDLSLSIDSGLFSSELSTTGLWHFRSNKG